MPTLEQDLASILADDLFSTCATFTLSSGELCVDGFFQGASDETLMFGNVAVEAAKPSFIAQTSLLTDVRTKQTVSIDGADYIVEKLEKTGVGTTTCYLKTKNG